MASPKCPRSAPQILENTTRRFSGSSDLARPKSMVCMKAAPFRKQRNMRPSATRRPGRRELPRASTCSEIHQGIRTSTMDEIVTEHTGGILRIQFNRPTKRNAMTSAMYVALAGIFNEAAKDESTRVVLWHGAGDSFCAGNDIEDFLENPPGPGESPQAKLMNAFVNFDKPVVVVVQGAAIGGGTTMLTHCDFIYAGESAKFQMPFINLAVVPEFGSSCSVPARIGHLRAAELILLGAPFDARRAADLGFVTQVVPDQNLLGTASETARELAAKPAGALQACKQLMKRPFREQIKAAMKAENEEFSAHVRSADAKEAFTAFLERRLPHFTGTTATAA